MSLPFTDIILWVLGCILSTLALALHPVQRRAHCHGVIVAIFAFHGPSMKSYAQSAMLDARGTRRMTPPTYIALILAVPRVYWQAVEQQPTVLRARLEAAGLLPVTAEDVRWHIDPVSQGLVIQARVPVGLEEAEK